MRVALLPDFRRNPYLTLLARALGGRGHDVEIGGLEAVVGADVVHLHWERAWTATRSRSASLVGAIRLLRSLVVARFRGATIVWTLHNLQDHDAHWPAFERLCQILLARVAHRIVVHNRSAVPVARAHLLLATARRIRAVPSGPLVTPQPGVERRRARELLGLPEDALVLAALGAIRRYKRLLVVAEAAHRSHRDDLVVDIAGWVGPGEERLADELSRLADGRSVRVHLGYLSDEEFDVHLAAADALLIATPDHFSSGAALQGVVRGRAIVSGGSRYVDDICGPGGHVRVGMASADDLASALRTLDRVLLRDGGDANQGVSVPTWDAVASSLEGVYRRA